jgi:hypothetical protein
VVQGALPPAPLGKRLAAASLEWQAGWAQVQAQALEPLVGPQGLLAGLGQGRQAA